MNGAVPTRVPAISPLAPPSQVPLASRGRPAPEDSSQPSSSAPPRASELFKKRRRPSSDEKSPSVEVTQLRSMPTAAQRGHSKRDVRRVELPAGAVDRVEPELAALDRDLDEVQRVHAERRERARTDRARALAAAASHDVGDAVQRGAALVVVVVAAQRELHAVFFKERHEVLAEAGVAAVHARRIGWPMSVN